MRCSEGELQTLYRYAQQNVPTHACPSRGSTLSSLAPISLLDRPVVSEDIGPIPRLGQMRQAGPGTRAAPSFHTAITGPSPAIPFDRRPALG
jgi:hypothetical protein